MKRSFANFYSSIYYHYFLLLKKVIIHRWMSFERVDGSHLTELVVFDFVIEKVEWNDIVKVSNIVMEAKL